MVKNVSSKVLSAENYFLSLIVDYIKKAAAAGRKPTNFLTTELEPTEHEIFTNRLLYILRVTTLNHKLCVTCWQ